MIFSSWQFILVFLPITFFVYFFLNRLRLVVSGKTWLVAANLFFYGYWEIIYVPLILGSVLVNFALGAALSPGRIDFPRKLLLTIGITFNLGLLGYFKYVDFLVDNINFAFATAYTLPGIVLPLAISFFTFQQIAYLVDSYKGYTTEYDFLNYTLFVTFFPQLIAGPIVHHREMMPQFASRWTLVIRYRNIIRGLFIFGIGLFKKVAIADTFAIWANAGFDGGQELDFYSAWATSLSYSFQLYFDFSGYCDMAIGAALLFNIRLPINFNSPYKALDIQDFWRRWHITLSHFLRDYLYIPLGGSRHSVYRTHVNLMATFLLGGLWHGASWMFVIWGALHGFALIVLRLWRTLNYNIPKPLAWIITFAFVNFAWVFFRADSLQDATRVLRGMANLKSAINLPIDAIPTAGLAWAGWLSDVLLVVMPNGLVPNIICFAMITIGFLIICQRNAYELSTVNIGTVKLATGSLLFSIAIYFTLASTSAVFLYYNF